MSENNTDRIAYVSTALGRHAVPMSFREIAQADSTKNRTRLSTQGRHCAGGPDCHHVHAAPPAAALAAVPAIPAQQQRGRRSDRQRSLFGPIATGLVRSILDNRPALTLIPGSNA